MEQIGNLVRNLQKIEIHRHDIAAQTKTRTPVGTHNAATQEWQKALIKLQVWFRLKADGTPYDYAEKVSKKNKKPIPVHDYFLTSKGNWYTDQKKCVKKALEWITKNEYKIDSVMIILRHRKFRREFTIGEFENGKGFKYFFEPSYVTNADGTTYIKDYTYSRNDPFTEDLK
jgi:hypothetical protein